MHNVAKVEAEGTAQAILNRFYYHRGWSVPVALSPEVQRTVTEFYGLDRVPVIFNGVNLRRCVPKTDYGLGTPFPCCTSAGLMSRKITQDCCKPLQSS